MDRENKVTVEEIIADVEQYFNLQPGQIKEHDRHKTVARARKLAMFLARCYTKHSYPELGDIFHRTHDCVIRAVKTTNIRSIGNFGEKYGSIILEKN